MHTYIQCYVSLHTFIQIKMQMPLCRCILNFTHKYMFILYIYIHMYIYIYITMRIYEYNVCKSVYIYTDFTCVYIYIWMYYLHILFGTCGFTKFVVSGDSQVIDSWGAHPLTGPASVWQLTEWVEITCFLKSHGLEVFLTTVTFFLKSNRVANFQPKSGDITPCETWYVSTRRRTWSTSQWFPAYRRQGCFEKIWYHFETR